MAFSEPHCLQLGTNYLERMSDRGCQHSGSYSRYYLIDALGLQLLIEHVVEATKGALFDAAGKCATEESFGSLSFIDVHSCFSDRVVSMKIC